MAQLVNISGEQGLVESSNRAIDDTNIILITVTVGCPVFFFTFLKKSGRTGRYV